MTLEINHLSGGYTRKKVLNDINFEIKSGEVVGLIGLNGAGKSTTINHIMGLMDPFEGEVLVNSKSLKEDASTYRKKVAFIPESPMIYKELTLKEHLEITAIAYDMSIDECMKRAEPLLKLFRLENRLNWFPTDFSKGMKQKVMIVSALVIDSDVLIIDEPFIGLDPLAIRDLMDLINQKKKEGTAILMSTHVLANAEKMCDSFVILHKGTIYARGTIDELRQQLGVETGNLDDIYAKLALDDEVSIHEL